MGTFVWTIFGAILITGKYIILTFLSERQQLRHIIFLTYMYVYVTLRHIIPLFEARQDFKKSLTV